MKCRYHNACDAILMTQIRGSAFAISMFCILICSCRKEYSREIGVTSNPPLGDDCVITSITPYDSATGKGYGSFHITPGTNNLAEKIEWFDSTSLTLDFQASLTYINDTIRINNNEFFLLDGAGRIKEFNTLENPSDTSSDRYKYTYAYDAGGHLYGKNWFVMSYSTDVPFFVYKYEWVNENLVGVEVNEASGDKRTALRSELKYNDVKTVKNFLYYFPDADELAPYLFAVNMGAKSKNLLEAIIVRIYDSGGNEILTYNTEYKNYQFSADDYVTEVYASGDVIDGLPLVNGLTRFEYECK